MAVRVLDVSKQHRTSNELRLRRCLGRFVTGVTVVTMQGLGQRAHGLTVNAFTSLSLAPPLVLVAINKRARGHRLLRGRPFAVNILPEGSERLARHFAGQQAHHVTFRWIQGAVAPRLSGALAYLECTPWAEYDAGDHTMFVGEVVEYGFRNDGRPLIFTDGRYVSHQGGEFEFGSWCATFDPH